MTTADGSHEFTELELKVILGMCTGLPNEEIAEGYKITTDVVIKTVFGIYDKAGVSVRPELYQFVRAALNNELRRRKKE